MLNSANFPLVEDVFQNKTHRQVVGDMLDNLFEVLKIYIAEWATKDAPHTSSKMFHEEL
jgi:hypothetical protein